LTAALIVTLGVIAWMFLQRPALDRGLLALNAAYAEGRPIEARLASFGYAAYPAGRSGGSQIESLQARRSIQPHYRSGLREGKSAAYHALGKLYLTDNDFDEAVKCFELALRNNATRD
jgi:tetratricopeptide (TPR) repeat protein